MSISHIQNTLIDIQKKLQIIIKGNNPTANLIKHISTMQTNNTLSDIQYLEIKEYIQNISKTQSPTEYDNARKIIYKIQKSLTMIHININAICVHHSQKNLTTEPEFDTASLHTLTNTFNDINDTIFNTDSETRTTLITTIIDKLTLICTVLNDNATSTYTTVDITTFIESDVKNYYNHVQMVNVNTLSTINDVLLNIAQNLNHQLTQNIQK